MKNKICEISLFSCILATITAMPGDAAVKINNSSRSYADAYNQVNAMRYQQEYMNAAQTATTASATASLPVAVDNEKLAKAILNNDESFKTSLGDLDSCAMIYPNGVFKWAKPESGVRQNQADQCVAVVELRDANTNAVLATTTLAAGDMMKCNIDYFPDSGLNMGALSQVILPADAAPTMADVEAVMNEEQKQNAGLKIVAATLISGIAGNMLAPKEAGQQNNVIPVGTGKTQLVGTAIGAATGAGIMAASTYSGKVAGDTIKSTAVNAASGMILGNMLAGTGGGESFLTIVKCNVTKGDDTGEHDCVVGTASIKGKEPVSVDGGFLIINKNKVIKQCEKEGVDFKCKPYPGTLVDIKINGETLKEFNKHNGEHYNGKKYVPEENNATKFKEIDAGTPHDDEYYKISEAYKVEHESHAYAVFANGALNSLTGYKTWDDVKGIPHTYYKRYTNGDVGEKITDTNHFEPKQRDASSGGLIDLSNKSRLKGTAVGAATGGALGGFAGYEGAKSEITDRWTSAQREYEDSLSNFVCMTGGRYLAKYNDYAEIPQPQKAK